MNSKNSPLTPFALLTTLSVILAVVSGCGARKPQENVIVRDTVVITKERKLIDTLILFKDTTIYQDRVKVKIEYRDNFVRVEADCPADTIKVTQVKFIEAKHDKKMSWEGLLGWIIAILCLLVIVRTVVQKLI